MNFGWGPNQLEQNSDIFYQYEEGPRAHTIKFMSTPINLPSNLLNNNRIINQKNYIQKNTLNQNIRKEILLKSKNPLESNKCSNNTSELEIIEYPINEFKKNDIKNINEIIMSKAKDYINDKSQNDILDYLKEKQGLNYLNLLLENDKYSNNSRYDKNDNSSKSDEIICSYVEIDHNNSIMSRIQKEKSVIKQSSKIFSQIHQSSYSDYSLALKKKESSNNKGPKTINIIKSKYKYEEKTIKVNKNMRKIKTDLKFKKIGNHINNNEHAHLKKKIIRKEDGIKSFLDQGQNENIKKSSIIKSNKKKLIFNKKIKLDTFRSIDYLNEINPINTNYKHTLNTINNKSKKSSGKSQIINSERAITNFRINKNIKNINTVNSKDKNSSHKSKNINRNSIDNTSKVNINSRRIKNKHENPLFNSINLKRNTYTNNKKGNLLYLNKSLINSMGIDSKKKIKDENKTTINSKSKLRKLLINNMNNSKQKFDLSTYNIKSINNQAKILIKKEKNKAFNKMNRTEIDKKINNSKLKNNISDNKKDFKNNCMEMSISKILKVNQY